MEGRKKLAIGGVISDYIPNPTFEVLAAPGAHEKWYRATNTEGLTLRELSGKPIPCSPAFRNGADRLKLMDEQGIHATLIFPTLASAVEERMSYDHELMNAVIHSLNEWIHAEWGFHREERLFAVPFVTLMDVDMAVAELEWALARGARTIGLRPAPVPGYRGSRSPGLPEFDPFWARVQEAGIFVSMHASDSGYDRFVRMWEGGREFLAFVPTPLKQCLAVAGPRHRRRARGADLPRRLRPLPGRARGEHRERQQVGAGGCSNASSTPTARCRGSSSGTRSRPSAATSRSRPSTRSRSISSPS